MCVIVVMASAVKAGSAQPSMSGKESTRLFGKALELFAMDGEDVTIGGRPLDVEQ